MFLLRTDHNPLTFLYGHLLNKRAGHRVARWRSRLRVYNFQVQRVYDKTPVPDNEGDVVALIASVI